MCLTEAEGCVSIKPESRKNDLLGKLDLQMLAVSPHTIRTMLFKLAVYNPPHYIMILVHRYTHAYVQTSLSLLGELQKVVCQTSGEALTPHGKFWEMSQLSLTTGVKDRSSDLKSVQLA